LKKITYLVALTLFLSSCDWFNTKPEIASVLENHFDNSLYNKFDTTAYHLVFSEKLKQLGKDFNNSGLIKNFYEEQNFSPVLVTRFFVDGSLDSLSSYLKRSKNEGFNPDVFDQKEISRLINTLNANNFKSIEEVYPVIADLELRSANSFLKYCNFMKYGAINPRKVFNRYYIGVKRPDTASMRSVLNSTDMLMVLKEVQPQSKKYVDLKQALAFYRDSLKTENHPLITKIKLNLERFRWQMPIESKNVVEVNIPDFSLTWLNSVDTLVNMKVCVGAKREPTYADKMKVFLKSGKLDDKPINHETPQLISVFNSIQVNPIWNIPVSIAQSEIYFQAIKDPFYLSNNNIKVYYKDKEIKDPDTIQWNRYSREKLPFKFKQGSGEGNALGKFKFIFENGSSIYLHDTNNKFGFKLSNRAISHGCVRIENPLKFAELLLKDQNQFDKLRMDVDLPPLDTTKMHNFAKILAKKTDTANIYKLKPTWFATKKDIVVLITYYTAWVQNNKVQFRPDVYAYDELLLVEMKKNM